MEAYRVGILNDDVIPPGAGAWPFPTPKLNEGYAQFFARARNRGLPVLLSNDADYGDGMIRRGWVHDGRRWVGLGDVPLAGVYDQFPSTTQRGRWIVADIQARGLSVVNNPKLTLVVDDKLLTYRNFPEIVPHTVYLNPATDDPRPVVEQFVADCDRLSWGEIHGFVAKEQSGWGARNLFKFTRENLHEIYQLPHAEFVLQPFLESSTGIPELGVRGRHDFRILIENGRFVTGMIRQPARHAWAANYFNPEDLIFLHSWDEIPPDFQEAAAMADSRLSEFYPRLVSYDLARLDNGRIVCWEMNSRPGMCADSDRPDDQQSSGALQEAILNCMEVMVGWR